MRFTLGYFLLLLSIAFVVLAAPVPTPEAEANTLEKRGYTGRATWYDAGAGLGSCGGWNSGGQKVVALSPSQNKGRCGKWIKIKNTKNGKTVTAKIVDTCPGCKVGSIDLSKAAFKALGSLDTGVLPVSWSYV